MFCLMLFFFVDILIINILIEKKIDIDFLKYYDIIYLNWKIKTKINQKKTNKEF